MTLWNVTQRSLQRLYDFTHRNRNHLVPRFEFLHKQFFFSFTIYLNNLIRSQFFTYEFSENFLLCTKRVLELFNRRHMFKGLRRSHVSNCNESRDILQNVEERMKITVVDMKKSGKHLTVGLTYNTIVGRTIFTRPRTSCLPLRKLIGQVL